MKLHNQLPTFLVNPATAFICTWIGLGLLYLSNARQLRRVATSSSEPRLVDTSGTEYRKIEKPKWLVPVLIVFALALIATPILAVGYSLAYKGFAPRPTTQPHPPAIAYLRTPKLAPKNTSQHEPQTIVQYSEAPFSPNIVGSGNQVTINPADRRIIQFIVLRVSIETDTPPVAISGPATDAGLQSTIALFTADKTRIRFNSDWLVVEQQVETTRKRMSFVYAPETPSDILGKDIAYLSQIYTLAVTYSEIFKQENFDTSSEHTLFHCEFALNGVTVGILNVGVTPAGFLNRGQANLVVAEMFKNMPAAYAVAVSTK